MISSQLFDTAQRFSASGQAFAMVSVLRVQAPTSVRPGDKALVLADGTLHVWVGSDYAVADIVAPAGQSIGACTPEEIALSALGAVVAHKRLLLLEWQVVVSPDPSAAAPTAAPAAASSCCGGVRAAAHAAETAPAAAAAPAAKCCCGGS
jgi:xanthine/CO dehydrogenase XdhC/CoxF family maturation factor